MFRMRAIYKKYEDHDLVPLLREKKSVSERAFEEIYNRYGSQVYSYIRYVTKNADDSDDLYQEVFMRFYKNVQKGSEIINLHSYLIKIARNLCLNYKRDKKNNVPIEEYHRIINDEFNLENRELFDIILRSLDLMDDKYKEAFILKKIEGLKFSEVAEVLEISEEGAKTRVNRARIKLLEILDPYLRDLKENA